LVISKIIANQLCKSNHFEEMEGPSSDSALQAESPGKDKLPGLQTQVGVIAAPRAEAIMPETSCLIKITNLQIS
jgi:hypothetical protein